MASPSALDSAAMRTSSALGAAPSTSTFLAAAAGSFPSFLSESSSALAGCVADSKTIERKIRVVVGNEAGDADSIVSSLALSYVHEGGLHSNEEGADDDRRTVPVVSIPRSDLALRRETVLLLGMCGIDAEVLTYIDDPVAASLLSAAEQGGVGGSNVELVLTDHNRLRSSLSHLSDAVVQILDHHEDEGSHVHVTGRARDVAFDAETKAAAVGSACTLVAERLFAALSKDISDADAKVERQGVVDPALALALLGVILLDTMDMSPQAGKGTERDGRAISSLLDQTDWTQLEIDDDTQKTLFQEQNDGGKPIRSKLHDYLSDSKFDRSFWDGMSAYDCLRIDYKRFEPKNGSDASSNAKDNDSIKAAAAKPPPPFGMSSVLLDLDSFLTKPDTATSIQRFMRRQEADVPLLAVLTMTLIDGVPCREMLLVGRKSLTESVWAYLLEDEDAKFLKITEYEEMEEGEKSGNVASTKRLKALRKELGNSVAVRRFRQGNPKGSRKQVAPVLLKKMSTLSSAD